MSSNKVLLVVGAGDLVGQQCVEQLIQNQPGDKDSRFLVRAVDKSQERLEELKRRMGGSAEGNLETMVVDLSRPESVKPALQGVRRVVLYIHNDPQREQNARNFIDQCKSTLGSSLEHFVLISIAGAKEGETRRQKNFASIEQHMHKSGITWTTLNPTGYQEILSHYFADRISQGQLPMPFKEDSRFSLVSINEIAECVRFVVYEHRKHQGQAYMLTGPEVYSGKELAQFFSQSLSREVKFQTLEKDEFSRDLTQKGCLSQQLAQELAEYWQWIGQKGHTDKQSGDSQRIGARSYPIAEMINRHRDDIVNGRINNRPL